MAHLDGCASLFRISRLGRRSALLCRLSRRVLGRPARMGSGGMDVSASRPMDRMDSAPAMGPAPICGQQCPLSDSPRATYSESCLENPGAQYAAAYRRLGSGLRPSCGRRGDLCRPCPLCGHVLSSGRVVSPGGDAGIWATGGMFIMGIPRPCGFVRYTRGCRAAWPLHFFPPLSKDVV